MFERDNNWMPVVLAFAIGGLIGAAIAMLVSPQSGPEMRSMIMDKSVEIKDKAASTVSDTRSRAGKAIEDLASDTKDKVGSITNRGQKAVDEQVKAAKKSISY